MSGHYTPDFERFREVAGQGNLHQIEDAVPVGVWKGYW